MTVRPPPQCLCDGVTLTPRQWAVIRMMVIADGRRIEGHSMTYNGNEGPTIKANPSNAEVDDLSAKLWQRTPANLEPADNMMMRCPVHPDRAWPPDRP